MAVMERREFLKLAGGAAIGSAGFLSSGAKTGLHAAETSAQGTTDRAVPSTWDAPGSHKVTDVEFGGLRARLTQPARPNGAGILIAPSYTGVSASTDEVGNWLADSGFTSVVWDPFSAYDPNIDATERRLLTSGPITDTMARDEQVKWLDFMESELGMRSLGTVGTCMGGRMSMLLAADSRIKAVSAHFPSLRPAHYAWELEVTDELKDVQAALQIHYPMEDTVTPYQRIIDTRPVFEARPTSQPTMINVYPGAHHGYLGLAPSKEPVDLQATLVAWPATIALLRATLL